MELLRILDECRAAGGGDCALATLVETHGATYRRAGARLLVRADRRTWGAISGGCIESEIISRGLAVIARREPALLHLRPADDDLIFGFGSGCQGEAVVLVEPLPSARADALHERLSKAAEHDAAITVYGAPNAGTFIGRGTDAPDGAFVQRVVEAPSLFVFGASPAAEALLAFGVSLGWRVHIGDHRPSIAADERFARAASIAIAAPQDLPSRFSYPASSAAVVMTHHYPRDLEVVGQLAERRLQYLGIVGSRDRAQRLLAELHAEGVDPAALQSVCAPAGLDLGADAPPEIALSIVAEIQAVLRRTRAQPLRDRAGRIHLDCEENVVAILAAGGSRRLGRAKQLVRIDGRSLVRRAAEAARSSGAGSVYVVVGAEAGRVAGELTGLSVDLVRNDDWRQGIASSIRAVVRAIEKRGHPAGTLTLMLCDQPGVSADTLRRLHEAHRVTHAPVVASRYPEGPGVPALFHRELFPMLKSLDGDIGARELIRSLDRDVVTVPLETPDDIDTSADLERFHAR